MLGVFAEFETNLRRERQLGSPLRRRAVSIRAASRRLTPAKFCGCAMTINWARRRSLAGSGSGGRVSIACWANKPTAP